MSDYKWGLDLLDTQNLQLQATTTVHGSAQPTIHYGRQLAVSSPILIFPYLCIPELSPHISHSTFQLTPTQLLLSQEDSL
jgi:hypothetical protein